MSDKVDPKRIALARQLQEKAKKKAKKRQRPTKPREKALECSTIDPPDEVSGCFQDINEYGPDRNIFKGEYKRSDDKQFNELHKVKDDGGMTVGLGIEGSTLYINPHTPYPYRDNYIIENGSLKEIKYQVPKDSESIVRSNKCIGNRIIVYIRLFKLIYEFDQTFYCERKEGDYLILYSRY